MTDREYIIVRERWTSTEGWRQIGDDPWEPINLHGGPVPFVWLYAGAEMVRWWTADVAEPRLPGLSAIDDLGSPIPDAVPLPAPEAP